MIDILEGFPDNVLAAACRGHVTQKDYETVLIPLIERKLQAHEKLRIYYEIGEDFSTIDPAAVFEDIKVGMSHLSRWERFAVVTDVEWIKMTMGTFGFFFPVEMKVFSLAEGHEARNWIVGS